MEGEDIIWLCFASSDFNIDSFEMILPGLRIVLLSLERNTSPTRRV